MEITLVCPIFWHSFMAYGFPSILIADVTFQKTLKNKINVYLVRVCYITLSVLPPPSVLKSSELHLVQLIKDVYKVVFILQKFHIASQGQFSQTRQMQTAVATYRAISLEILRGAGSSGTHFVRCIRTDLTKQPRGFHHELVRQQLRALAVLDTAQARQKGYSHRIPFAEFICR